MAAAATGTQALRCFWSSHAAPAPCSGPPNSPRHAHGQVRISAAGTSTSPLATSQEPQCSSSPPTQPRLPARHAVMRAGQAGGGWEMLQEHRVTPCHRHPARLGQDDPSWGHCGCKGDKLPLPMLLPQGTPQSGPNLSSGCKPRARGAGRARSRLSPEVGILTCAFFFAHSSAWEQGRHLIPTSLTSELEHPQGPHSTQEAPAAASPQFISH